MSNRSPYGYCPICGANGISRERRPNGNDRCEKDHIYPSKDAIPSLTPVDTEQCQTEVEKYRPFIMGGRCHTVTRCGAKPAFVVTEIEADEDGRIGAMSLCAMHLLKFQENMPNHDTAYIKQTVEEWKEFGANGK